MSAAAEKDNSAPAAEGEQQQQPPKTEEKKEEVTENGHGGDAEKEQEQKEPPKEMRAVVLTGFGGLKTVKIQRKPEPAPAEGEVLIRVKACGLNFQDLMVRQGVIDSPPKCPIILGFECAGEVEQVGEGVEDFAVGDQVVALPEYRAWAELVAVPTKFVYRLPEGVSPLDAASFTMSYTVAHILLFDVGGLSDGKSLVVHSAGGGVGQAVIHLARTVPDVTVFAVCSKAKHEPLRAAGCPADHLLERGNDYAAEVRKVVPDGVDLVLDCLCGDECNRGYSLLRPMGRYVLYGSANVVSGETKSFFSAARAWWQVDKVSPLKLFEENKTISGFNLRRLMYQQNGADYVRSRVLKVLQLFKDGKIKPMVDSTWALEDVAEAMQKMHDRKNIGKIVLDPSLEPKPKPATPAKTKDKKKQSSEEKKENSDEKKEEKEKDEKKEEKKEEPVTNGESAGDTESKEKESSS